jgi:peptidoglycan/LPS O-acetylase OafA/YrhL
MSHGAQRIIPLDGLRGVAVLLVLLAHTAIQLPLTHARFSALAFGAMGVRLFFVLSGFLITGIV